MTIAAAISLGMYLLPKVFEAVKSIEALFGAKTGPVKKKAVVSLTQQVADLLESQGLLPEKLDPDALGELVEQVVSVLQPEFKGEELRPTDRRVSATIESGVLVLRETFVEEAGR